VVRLRPAWSGRARAIVLRTHREHEGLVGEGAEPCERALDLLEGVLNEMDGVMRD
jgi:hypothetical protein